MVPTTAQDPASLELRNVLQEFLVDDLVNIVDSYLAHSAALETLVLGTDGKPVDSELNRATIDAIKIALTSTTCDPDITRQIFQNAVDNGYTDVLNTLMDDLRSQNQPIILDNVNFSGLDLRGLKFDQASCTKAVFTDCNLHQTSFAAANLTDAEGLPGATGVITINCTTSLGGTGLVFDAERIQPVFGETSFGYVLANPPQLINQQPIDLGGWTIVVSYD